MKRLGLWCSVVLVCFGMAVHSAQAASDVDATIKVLPLDCVFEIVDDGTNEIRYLTPEKCGQKVDVPGVSPLPVTTPEGSPVAYPIGGSVAPPAVGGDKLYLNEFPEFTSGPGKVIIMTVGQKIYLLVSSGQGTEEHSFTLKEIGANYVVITIASTAFDVRLYVGETKTFDLNHDGHIDVVITLNNLRGQLANITFKQLRQTAKQPASTVAGVPHQGTFNPLWLVAALIAMLLLWRIAKRRRSRHNA